MVNNFFALLSGSLNFSAFPAIKQEEDEDSQTRPQAIQQEIAGFKPASGDKHLVVLIAQCVKDAQEKGCQQQDQVGSILLDQGACQQDSQDSVLGRMQVAPQYLALIIGFGKDVR